jgi:hypothetical protein
VGLAGGECLRDGVRVAVPVKNELGGGHLPDSTCSGRIALANSMGWNLSVGSVLLMLERQGKGCLRLWEDGTLGSSGSKGLGTPGE